MINKKEVLRDCMSVIAVSALVSMSKPLSAQCAVDCRAVSTAERGDYVDALRD